MIVIIVTGGSKGLGLATVKALVDQGAKVGILARSQDAIDKAVAAIGADKVAGFSVDVADQASVKSAFQSVFDHYGNTSCAYSGLPSPKAYEA